MEQYAEILEAHSHLHQLMYEHWRQYEFLTYQWWLLLGVLIIPWFIWWKLVDKTRVAIIFSYGLFIMFLVITMDALGIVNKLWIYPVKLLPIIPHTISIDWSMLPILHMLLYQYFPHWKSFLIAETAAAALLAFVGEPIATRLGVYYILYWQHIWSFPIYVGKAVLAKWFIERLIHHRP